MIYDQKKSSVDGNVVTVDRVVIVWEMNYI